MHYHYAHNKYHEARRSTNLAFLGGHVRGVGAGVGEALAAVLALEGLFSAVDPLVLLKKREVKVSEGKVRELNPSRSKYF